MRGGAIKIYPLLPRRPIRNRTSTKPNLYKTEPLQMKLDPKPHEAKPCNERTNLAIYEPSIRPQVLESDKPDGSPPHHCEGYSAIQINPYTRKQLRMEHLDSHCTLPCDWTRVLRYRQDKVDDNILTSLLSLSCELAPYCQVKNRAGT